MWVISGGLLSASTESSETTSSNSLSNRSSKDDWGCDGDETGSGLE